MTRYPNPKGVSMRFLSVVAVALALALPARADDPPKVDLKKGVEFTGRAEATVVEIRPRVTGFLNRVLVKDGADVKKGDLLAEVDDRVYRLELASAKAKLALSQAEAKIAAVELARVKEGFDKGVFGREELARAEGGRSLADARADVVKAEVALAELNLSWTKLTSPIDGRLGFFTTTAGNLLKADETAVVTVVATDPLFVRFDIDERTVIDIRRAMRDTKDGKPTVAAGFTGEDGYPHPATIVFTDSRIDPETGTLRFRAIIPNPKGEHLPGASVRVKLTVQPGK